MHNALRMALICLAAILTAFTASADLKKFMLVDYIYDQEWDSVDSCEVEIYKDDTVKVNFKLLTGNDATKTLSGNQLRALVNSGIGIYRISLFKDGYTPATTTFRIGSVSENTKYLRTIRMEKELTRKLNEVTVTGTRVKMVMKGDTVVFDAAAFRLDARRPRAPAPGRHDLVGRRDRGERPQDQRTARQRQGLLQG